MRKLIEILVVIILMLPVSGCYELIATSDKAAINTSVDALMIQVDEFQDVFKEAAAADLINAEETKERNDQIDKIQKFVVVANEAIEESPNLIEAVIKTNQASAPVNPYAGVIDAVLKIIAGSALVGGTGAAVKIVKDGKEKKQLVNEGDVVKRKYAAEKRGLEKLRIAHPESYDENYKYVGDVRKALGIG